MSGFRIPSSSQPVSLEHLSSNYEPGESSSAGQAKRQQQLMLPPPPNICPHSQITNHKFNEAIKTLNWEIQQIRSAEGHIEIKLEESMRQIRENISQAKTQLEEVLIQLFEEYQTALKSYHETGLEPFQDQLVRFGKELQKSLWIYEDLTYGLGRFEEHDGYSKQDLEELMQEAFNSSPENLDIHSLEKDIHSLVELYGDEDYEQQKFLCQNIRSSLNILETTVSACEMILQDQESSVRMSEKIARRDIVEAIKNSDNDGEALLSAFENCLEECCEASSAFLELIKHQFASALEFSEITQTYVHTQECLEALESMKRRFANILPIIQQMVIILEKEKEKQLPERYDDPWNPYTVAALKKECERLNGLEKSATKILDESTRLNEEIVLYSEKTEEEEVRAQALENRGRSFIKELKSLKNKFKPSHQPKERIQTLRKHPDFIDNIDACLTTMIRLIHKKELSLEVSVKQYDHIREELRKKWEQLEEDINAGKDQEALIDLYIEIQRLQAKYDSLWTSKVNVASEFIKRIGNVVDGSTPRQAVYATTPSTLYCSHIMVRHPLDSPFTEVIHKLAISGIGSSQWRNFFLISTRPFTSFERGIFDVVLKPNIIDRIVCDAETFEATLSCNPTKQNTSVTPINNIDPEYYKIFNLTSLPPIAKGITLTSSIINLYGLVAMHLAYTTASYEKRMQLRLPPGHPIAALLVSKNGQILSWAVNTIDENGNKDPVRHAEINAIFSYFLHYKTNQIPEGAVLFTSLKPCSMCAGGIKDAGQEQLAVYYGQNDPPQPNNTPKCSQVQMQVVKDIDVEYTELKKTNPGLNAAKSLIHLNTSSRLKKALINQGKENPISFNHIQNFWKQVMGDFLSYEV